jgi:hypothetical protein
MGCGRKKAVFRRLFCFCWQRTRFKRQAVSGLGWFA